MSTHRSTWLKLSAIAVAGASLPMLGGPLAAQEFIPLRSPWRYMDDGVDRYTPSPPFYSPTYNDVAWKTGQARLGYGGDGETTTLLYGGVPSNKHIATYFRHEFNWDETTP